MNKKLIANLKNLITAEELIITLMIVVVLLIVSVIAVNPIGRLREQADEIRKQQLVEIDKALTNYVMLSEDGLPTFDGGNALPTVTITSVVDHGINLSRLDNFAGEYLSTVPVDPDGKSYKVGVISGGSLVVGIALSDGTPYTL